MANDPLDCCGALPAKYTFAAEFEMLITTNHQLSLEGIKRSENEILAGIADADERSNERKYYDQLRTTANNLAIVAIVTRLDHWVTRYCNDLKLKPTKGNGIDSQIIKKLDALNKSKRE